MDYLNNNDCFVTGSQARTPGGPSLCSPGGSELSGVSWGSLDCYRGSCRDHGHVPFLTTLDELMILQ